MSASKTSRGTLRHGTIDSATGPLAMTARDRYEIRELELEATALATAVQAEKGRPLDWARSMFSIREGAATSGPDGLTRRRHLPMQIDQAVAWARAGMARREDRQTELFPTSCGDWGFCG